MFERFSRYARRAVVLSQESARDLRHPEIDTVHLLLGLAGEERGAAAAALVSAGVTRDAAEAALLRTRPADASRTDDQPDEHLPFSADAKRALEMGLRSALELRADWIFTVHLLLGVLAVPDSTAGQVLDALSVSPDAVQEQAMSRSGTVEPLGGRYDDDA